MGANTNVFFAVDRNGTEHIFDQEPKKLTDLGYWFEKYGSSIMLPTGTIKKLTGKKLTWDDGFIDYIGDNYDPSPATQWYDEA